MGSKGSGKKRVLLVEDEASIAVPLSFLLSEQGFKVKTAADGREALAEFERRTPDLVLLDVMLPSPAGTPPLSGIDVCQRIRATSDVPIIMLTAKGSEVDKVLGLEVGADDYVTKPYSSRELLARIKSVTRRSRRADAGLGLPEEEHLAVGPIELDLARHEVTVDGAPVELPLKEFQLLAALMRNAGRVMTRGQLLAEVWGADFFGDERTLDVHIKRLRSRISSDGAQRKLISTVRGVGYRFED